MSSRPMINVHMNGKETSGTCLLPAVFTSPIRQDIVQSVHTNMNKNKRQPYAVSQYAGHQTSAESWGTGRAVARIPRVPGGGTHRSGQAAFGNMCRGGRMFAPTKTFRRWQRKTNRTQRRYALVSALAASALPSIVMARGHKIEQVPEIPLVIDNKAVDSLSKTSAAVTLLKALGVYDDVEKVKDTIKIRSGHGKARNRRWVVRRGPLIIYNQKGPLTKAFRNLPGIDLCCVSRLNLLQLAPGGHLGRFVVWIKDAFERLDSLYGTYKKSSAEKLDYNLPRAVLSNSDLRRVINSDEIQTKLRPKIPRVRMAFRKRNPLKNLQFAIKLNPYAAVQRRKDILSQQKRAKAKAELVEKQRKGVPVTKDKKVVEAEKALRKKLKAQNKKSVKALLS